MSAPLSPEEFKADHPHFARMDEDTIGFYLDYATAMTNATVFGADHRMAVSLLAAHYLSISPRGQKARLESDRANTVYYEQFLQLLHIKTAAGRIV